MFNQLRKNHVYGINKTVNNIDKKHNESENLRDSKLHVRNNLQSEAKRQAAIKDHTRLDPTKIVYGIRSEGHSEL
jgi:hypothetical protein